MRLKSGIIWTLIIPRYEWQHTDCHHTFSQIAHKDKEMDIKQEEQNVSAHEVNKFNELGDYWWDPQGPLKTLHQVQPVRMNFIRSECSLFGKKIIDVGCGGGILTEALSLVSHQVVGIDKAPDVIEVAKMHSMSLPTPPQYVLSSAEAYAKSCEEDFDVVTCLELIEHVPSPESLIQALAKMLKPGGDLFISTLNRTSKSYMTAILGAEYLLNVIPKGTHDYHQFIKPSELSKQARLHGLQLKTLKGIQYRILHQDFVLDSNCSVNYIAHFTKEL